jgi:hypothetical protein
MGASKVKVKVWRGHHGKVEVEVGMDKLPGYLLPYLAEAYFHVIRNH